MNIIQLDPSEIEQVESSFPCVSLKTISSSSSSSTSASSTSTKNMTFEISIPHYKTEEDKEMNQSDYQNAITVTIVLGISLKKQVVLLRELVVTSSIKTTTEEEDPSTSQINILNETDCQTLQHMYTNVLLQASETGEDDDYLSFSVEQDEADKNTTNISSNGALFTLIVQMMTDATDSQLQETLSAHQIQTKVSSSKNDHMMKKMSSSLPCSSSQQQQQQPSSSQPQFSSTGVGMKSNSSSSLNSTPLQSPNQQKPTGNSDFPLNVILNNSKPTSLNVTSKAMMMNSDDSSSNSNNNNNTSTNTNSGYTNHPSLMAMINNGANNNNIKDAIKYSTPSLVKPQYTKLIRVRICKIDHMRNEKMYLGNISENFETLKVDPVATYFENEGLLGVMTVNDPNSPRVLLCLMSLVLVSSSSNASFSSSPLSSSSSSTTSNNNNNNFENTIPCAGSQLIKELRMNVTDVDSHGRKCRERMMRDLGAWNVHLTSESQHSSSSSSSSVSSKSRQQQQQQQLNSSTTTRSVAEYYKTYWSSDSFKKMTPSTREEGVSLIKRIFVEPFVVTAAAGSGGGGFVSIANDILNDKNLWDHV